ncbi:hypothetical protein ACS0TY_008679 [Phlomoides rotata]
MLSFTKTFTCFPPQIPSSSRHPFARSVSIIRSSSDNNGNSIANDNELKASASDGPAITPSDAVEIRFKRGSRRRRKQLEDGGSVKTAPKKEVKDWESMTFQEKAVELYVGEKGALFWLNKLAYASIYVVIGGWIVFRFVGPALNLYQLDTPPLAPSSLFKG